MDSELRLVEKLKELSQLEPGLGYRAYHAKLKEHPDFASIGLKKVQTALQHLRGSPLANEQVASNLPRALPIDPLEESAKDATDAVLLAEIPGRGKGYLAKRKIKRGEALLHDVAVCAALVGEGDIAELEAQCRRGRLDEVMCLTHGAGTEDLPGKIQNNVFQTTRDVEYCALFARVARLNHSCCPNAFVDCSRKNAVVRALVNIEESEEVLISYVPVSDCLELRKEKLEGKGFCCDCKRCQAEAASDPSTLVPCAEPCNSSFQLDTGEVSCPSCGSILDMEKSRENFLHVQQVNDFMRTPEASQTDTRKLISQLLTVKDAAMKSPGAVPPRNLHFLTLLNNLSNLHFFCAQNLKGQNREDALLAFFDCKALMMTHYQNLHGGSPQRDISYLVALQRLLTIDLGNPPEQLRKAWQAQLQRASLLQYGEMQLPNLEGKKHGKSDVRFCICYDDDSPVIIACLWARLKGLDFEDVVASLCEERAEWDKGGESRLVERSTREDGSSEEVYHTLIRCPRPFWDREILKRQWRLPLDCQHGQGCALISRSLQDNIGDKDPEKVRAFVHKAGALIRPAQDCASPEASVCSAGTNHEEDLLSLPIANHFCSTGTELTSCSQIDMGGLIPAWATNYLSSFVVGKALSWTEDLRRHCASRKLPSEDADNVPTLAEISKDLMPGWTENWDDTELVVPEDGDGLRKDTSLTSMAWSHFWSSGELSS
ncbi:unnamed protein product [Cladocopium goreaui]|uniref:SET domain-containing protein n=1 Tax=Cladocopium goreaui TaxID=2562237 RepID=A0A9P1C5B9_9DINO|nr:unnamed protein product [Cladocopium goreaui]